jgi:hypothetical protein
MKEHFLNCIFYIVQNSWMTVNDEFKNAEERLSEHLPKRTDKTTETLKLG